MDPRLAVFGAENDVNVILDEGLSHINCRDWGVTDCAPLGLTDCAPSGLGDGAPSGLGEGGRGLRVLVDVGV